MKRFYALLIATLFVLAACGTQTADGVVFKTADPRFNVGFRLFYPPVPPVEPAVLPEATEVIHEATAQPEEEATATPECNIKVNWSGTEWIYHLPGQVSYDRTLIEPDKSEFFACTEQQAIDAGARKALR